MAAQLNAQGYLSDEGQPFRASMATTLLHSHQLRPRWERLRARGLLTLHELETHLHVCADTAERWHDLRLLRWERVNDKGVPLLHLLTTLLPPSESTKHIPYNLSLINCMEVQCETHAS